jgi:hypothetical protein
MSIETISSLAVESKFDLPLGFMPGTRKSSTVAGFPLADGENRHHPRRDAVRCGTGSRTKPEHKSDPGKKRRRSKRKARHKARQTKTATKSTRKPEPAKRRTTDLRRNAPSRPVDWRWQRAKHLVESGKPLFRRLDDEHILRAVEFQLAQARCRTDADQQDLRDAAADISDAFQVWNDDTASRWELEARILAGESPASIARKLATTEEVVMAYEAMFFHVSDRLDAPGWIVHRAIGPKIHRGLRAADYGVLWKFFGYAGGEHVLDFLIHQRPGEKPQHPGEVPAFLDNDIWETLRRKAVIALRTLSVDDPSVALKLMRLWLRHQEIEIKRQERTREHGRLMSNVRFAHDQLVAVFTGDNFKDIPGADKVMLCGWQPGTGDELAAVTDQQGRLVRSASR